MNSKYINKGFNEAPGAFCMECAGVQNFCAGNHSFRHIPTYIVSYSKKSLLYDLYHNQHVRCFQRMMRLDGTPGVHLNILAWVCLTQWVWASKGKWLTLNEIEKLLSDIKIYHVRTTDTLRCWTDYRAFIGIVNSRQD